jgi:small-conductance mechanosensitive channel
VSGFRGPRGWLPAACGIVALGLTFGSMAQDTGAAAEVAMPDPAALATNWWGYFGNAGDALPAKVAEFEKRLESITDAGPSAASLETINAVDEIVQSLDFYSELKTRKLKPPEEMPTAAQSYSVATLLDLVSQIRDLQLETQIEQEEIKQRETAVRRARDKLNDLKAAYFELGDQAPTRLATGLYIIRDRLRLEIAEEELRLLKPQLQQKEERLSAMRNLLDAASTRLTASREDVESYVKQRATTEAEVKRLSDEAAFYRLRGTGIAETPEEHAQARRFRQRLVDFDVRIATAELARIKAHVAVALTSRFSTGAEAGDDIDLSNALVELKRRLDDTDKLRSTWRRATDSERTSAEAQFSLAKDQNSTLAAAHRKRIEQADRTLEALAALREQLAKGYLLADLAAGRVAEEKGSMAVWLAQISGSVEQLWAGSVHLVTGSLFTINETPVTLLGLFRILMILAVAWWLSKIVRHGLDRMANRTEAMNRASLYTVGRLFHYAILTLGIVIGLSSIGLDFTKLALFVSALGVGLGFGLQAIFSNFVAGLIILFEKSLKVGDFVDLESGVTGEVKEINIRSTLVTTNDNIDILVPNSEFVNGRVINWTLREAYRRLRVPFGVAYGSDKETVKKAALEAAEEVPFTLTAYPQRQPQVWLVEFGDSSLNFELVVWLKSDAVKRPMAVQAAYTWQIETALNKYGIEIPFPQRDLHLRSGFKELVSSPQERWGEPSTASVAASNP